MPSEQAFRVHRIDVNKLIKKNYLITVEMVGMRRFRVKVWIGKQLIRLAALILGCEVRFEPLKDAEMEQ